MKDDEMPFVEREVRDGPLAMITKEGANRKSLGQVVKKASSDGSKLERELRKLECSVSYKTKFSSGRTGRSSSESDSRRKGGIVKDLLASMRRFSQFIEEMCLKDLPLLVEMSQIGGACKGFKMQGVEERFQKKLAWWKGQYLSKGGRQTLIKSTLSNLPIYYMSPFVVPKRVAARLENIQRISFGVIVGKYGQEDEGWCTNGVRERYGVGVWKAIRNGWEDLKVRMHFKVGSGNRASSKDVRVADDWDGDSWNPRFVRQLNDWELEEVDIFFERLYDHSISMDMRIQWSGLTQRVVPVRVSFLLGRQLGLRY
ncbi:hypothetical protein CK203_058258 [Vitis vinifera]|uniref:Uncharacterized protein n=1 Tax=Vitis vinifera TaxID=29760 RepID=A0A438FTR8_VITVI|nr:hypothetical protein CK203_058258 [Vitis vinifera]